MRGVAAEIETWTARRKRVALATVIAVRGSAPRPPGAKMAICEDGAIAGSVSGGCVEGAVVVAAEEVLDDRQPRVLRFGIADAAARDVGLPCGGEIDVLVEPLETASPQARFLALVREGGRAALATAIGVEGGAPDVDARLLVLPDGDRYGSLGSAELDAAAAEDAIRLLWTERSELCEHGGVSVFVDVTAPPPRLVVFGAVELAAALCRIARAVGWLPYVVDPRSRFARAERFPEAERVIAAWPHDAFEDLGAIDPATYIAVLTHDPKLDDAALGLALGSEAAYIGAMGSRRAQASRRERLLQAGFTDAELERIAAPVGLDLGALSAEETALSIMAEVVAVRHGRAGGRLSATSGRIHEARV